MTADHLAIVISVGGLLFSILTMVVSGVWIVSKVETTTKLLSEAINRLEETLQAIDDRQRDHGDRLTRLEAHNGSGR